MSSTAARATAAALLGGVLALTTAAPVGAAVGVVRDPAGDGRTSFPGGDVTKIRVKHGPQALRLIVSHAEDSGLADVYRFNVDTDPGSAGPEYAIGAGIEVEQWSVVRAKGWKGMTGGALCTGDTAIDWDGEKMRLVVPRDCLGSPERVRVNLVTANDYPGTPVDHAPGKKTFGAWVTTG
ncbi:hypothetical protein [Nocardioides marmotae]|uniref:hypothetical protein n=1 Tax=Nocardioides marmotae TaxID=2663857 RepID=UPI0012B6547B|nr:hypothetical protein [Nocardioides marmotae]MBC9735599.1 hypothetical protein [Nocardioides marmotae]MTB86695.1 hypothetical protein [Nocardioides marmotae]